MNLTAKDVAEKIGANLEGDAALELIGVAAPERAAPKHLIYVEAAKHAERAAQSAAACVIAIEGIPLPGKTVLRTTQPKVAFAKAARILLDARPIASGIHSTAIVAPMARIAAAVGIGPYAVIGEDTHIGEGTQIGAHTVIGAGCWIGERCRIHPRVTLYPGIRIGNDVEIHSGAVIGADGFGYAFDGNAYWKFPQAGIVEIEDHVEIGANATIDRGSLDDTRIGPGVKIDNLVHVGHNVQIGAHTVIAAQTGISGSSKLGHHVVCGGQVGIADHCTLQDQSIAGAQAGIPTGKTIRSGQTVWGTPARPLDKFKEAYAWFARLPELGERIKKLEEKS
ncbi:MAG TPA: UDP-3-O-(3-hydroxymyristoyl)glucosamine N-acyltransferase [Candidatus Sulfotelmatobacter sp.]|nr:UDP-3-O-(3-hydroxymyristoyl)glucosamine N-acyltransferase [Candidatus Sulfotelmatobacter sp.]